MSRYISEEGRINKGILDIINLYYTPGSLAHDVLVRHSEVVAGAAVSIATRVVHLEPDIDFVWEAAMLHDIGIFYTHSPGIGCSGDYDYVCHGYLGRTLLEKHALYRHARVCERHVGVGLEVRDISGMGLPIPVRDMRPKSIEEKIICYADLFFSKTPAPAGTMHTVDSVRTALKKFGQSKVDQFNRWLDMFGPPPAPAACDEISAVRTAS